MSTRERSHPVMIVTGLSGAGKSLTLRALEDFGCEVIDNLPISLCSGLILQKPLSRPLALGIDARTRDFDPIQLIQIMNDLKCKQYTTLQLLFLEASSEIIQQRYRETRRFHPLGMCGNLTKRIEEERTLLCPIRELAEIVLDTSFLSPPELRKQLQELLPFASSENFVVHLVSFAYRNRVPAQADMVFDMRFLVNPYYRKDLRFLTGKASSIQEYMNNDTTFQKFLAMLKELLVDLILPSLQREGRREFIVAFGCTGGRHRSVLTAEMTANFLKEMGYQTRLYHRELT